jgi:hypothetical protein
MPLLHTNLSPVTGASACTACSPGTFNGAATGAQGAKVVSDLLLSADYCLDLPTAEHF